MSTWAGNALAALLERLAWDAVDRRYATLSELRDYSARVASAVGAMMCVLMRVRDPHVLARACDLGVAMQLTNIARDVGEDARAGRLFLPRDWPKDAGIDPVSLLPDPESTPQIRRMVTRLLAEADRLYPRSESGIAALPRQARKVADQARVDTAELGVSGDGCAVAVGAGGHHCAFSDRPVGRARLCPLSGLGQHRRRPELGDGAPEPQHRPAEHRRDLIPGPPQHAQPIVRTQFAQQAIGVTLRL